MTHISAKMAGIRNNGIRNGRYMKPAFWCTGTDYKFKLRMVEQLLQTSHDLKVPGSIPLGESLFCCNYMLELGAEAYCLY